MTVKISHAHRDAIYGQMLNRLSGIDDIYTAASAGRFDQADRLGREFSDDLRLILHDIGWGAGPELEIIELTTPPDVLRRVFDRLHGTVITERISRAPDWDENRKDEERNRLVGEACQEILARLDDEGGSQ